MVVQGVKNPMVDLLSLEDKTLDEVMLATSCWELHHSERPLHFALLIETECCNTNSAIAIFVLRAMGP